MRKGKADPFLKMADYIGDTARELNHCEDGIYKPFFILPVPLMDERQCYYLRVLADQGILGQNPHEVAAHLITEGIMSRMGNKMAEDWRLYPPESWQGFEGESMAEYLESLRNRSCVGKHKHESFAAVTVQMNRGKKNSRNTLKGVKLNVYECQFCGFFHIGHKSKGKKK